MGDLMPHTTETLDEPKHGASFGEAGRPRPGLLLVYSAGRPALADIPLPSKGTLEIGRATLNQLALEDSTVSRQHVQVHFSDGGWIIHDLGSRNGTAMDGLRVVGERAAAAPRVLRAGTSLFLFQSDLRPFRGAAIEVNDGVVLGPTLRQAMATVARAARAGRVIHVSGESGTGKELVARAFHRFGPCPSGPFVAVNCANIPHGLAERLLFGVRRGAYSGANSDATGYLQSAHGGTLFLVELAELDLQVQAKLLRALDTQEIMPLGASRALQVEIRLCSATHRSLPEQVRLGLFREDLYYRIARPSVVVPPLRERAEEIPWLAQRVLDAAQPPRSAHASLIEECLLRSWPGNVRELLLEIRAAMVSAGDQPIERGHLAPSAGAGLRQQTRPDDGRSEPGGESARDDEIRIALRRERGNVSRAAVALGLHRTQLRRWIAKNNAD
jgi:transcriptional regulator with PAS, ATPase and Fis domain